MRFRLFEIHDHPAFPVFLRDLVTEALQSLWDFGNCYRPLLPRLQSAIDETDSLLVLDLCSGGGGPWLSLAPHLKSTSQGTQILLTDKFPNQQAIRHTGNNPLICYEPRPVDATSVPSDLNGFRTIFSAFHHFTPTEAQSILADAFHHNQGIAILEAASPCFKTMLTICFIPILSIYLALRARPLSLSRLFFTCILPVIPFVLWFDGIVSCLRVYSMEELKIFIDGLHFPTYRWEIGEDRSGYLPITYLIGHPVSTALFSEFRSPNGTLVIA